MKKLMTKKELQALSKEERKGLISEKISKTKYTDSLSFSVTKPVKEAKGKADSPDIPTEKNTLDVTIVCNTAWLCDSHMDVLSGTSYDASVSAKGSNIPHIADHKQSSTSHVGDVTKVYTKSLDSKALGFLEGGETTALFMESTVRKDYNEEVFKFYKNGKINQHSIGIRYIDIKLAINSEHEDDVEEKAVWDEAYPHILNKDKVDKSGFFWFVKEIDIIENSCVLFGANSLTPTLEVKSELPTTTPTPLKVGKTMELHEALAKVSALEADLAASKAATATSEQKGVEAEQTRILAILKSSEALGMDKDLALKQIKSNASADTALVLFEAVAEAVQKAAPIKTDTLETTVNPVTTEGKEKSFMQGLEDAIFSSDETAKDAVKWEMK